MNKLTEDQMQKLELLNSAVYDLNNANVVLDFMPAFNKALDAGLVFRYSLPFVILDEQLQRFAEYEIQTTDWDPKTILEKDLYRLLRMIEELKEDKTLFQFSTSVNNIQEVIYDTIYASNAEYPDNIAQFRGETFINEGPPM